MLLCLADVHVEFCKALRLDESFIMKSYYCICLLSLCTCGLEASCGQETCAGITAASIWLALSGMQQQ